ESCDNGKAISLARRLDIPRAVANFRFFATAILHDQSDAHVTDGAALNYTLRQPLGVAGLISPWNLPLYLLSWKIAPAIATGNTCIAKPSELTPLTASRLAELSIEAGVPPGVINIVHGYGQKAGRALASHPDVPLISFTGGTVTGAAEKIRTSFSPTPISTNASPRRFARASGIRARSVCADRASSSSARCTTHSSNDSSQRRNNFASAIRSMKRPTSVRSLARLTS